MDWVKIGDRTIDLEKVSTFTEEPELVMTTNPHGQLVEYEDPVTGLTQPTGRTVVRIMIPGRTEPYRLTPDQSDAFLAYVKQRWGVTDLG